MSKKMIHRTDAVNLMLPSLASVSTTNHTLRMPGNIVSVVSMYRHRTSHILRMPGNVVSVVSVYRHFSC